ncbi:DUF3298 domain-containing protein [Brevibacillus laterosporus]|uniref:DUF3298 and DUF4163 domain-containing protein n=1 Tax=Brevibacillus laterosporus TaxID=1465 RepID=UPI003D2414F5
MNKNLEELRKEYKNMSIPKELDFTVKKSFQQKQTKKRIYILPAGAVAAAVILTAVVNFNPKVAHGMSQVPVLKEIVKVITFTDFKEEKENIKLLDEFNSNINVETPVITGLKDKKFEAHLNKIFEEDSKQLYDKFKNEEHFMEIRSYSDVVTDNPTILSIHREIEISFGNAPSIENRYVTVDKEKSVVLTLKDLFKNDQYIDVISENIKEQMTQQMKEDEKKRYWIKAEDMVSGNAFTHITSDQQFYINKDNKLVISFDKYEVAPGYMGSVEFEIPLKVISDILVGVRYIH